MSEGEIKNQVGIESFDDRLNSFLKERNAEVVNINPSSLEENEDIQPLDLIKVKLQQKSNLDPLPMGYMYMGGAARNIVLQEFGQSILPPRDIDIVGIRELNPNLNNQDYLSRRYMGDDLKHGHGVKIEAINDYFRTRDFTINEVLSDGVHLYATVEALRDLQNKIIRPTTFEKYGGNYSDTQGHLSSKLVMKALRLFLEFRQTYGTATIEEISDWEFDCENIRLRDIALHLDKSSQQSDAFAEEFASVLIRLGTINPYEANPLKPIGNATELAISLQARLGEFMFKSPGLLSLMSDEKEARNYNRLAESYLHRIKHLDDPRREVV